MNQLEARQAAESARTRKDVPNDYRLQKIEQEYIEVAGEDPTQPAPVRDVLVWSAVYSGEKGRWIELSMDDSNGQVVRVLGSR